MAELSRTDVVNFTNNRLVDDDANGQVQQMLDAALASARRRVGWMVSPVQTTQTVVLDGPDSRILQLPTRKLVTLSAVTEDGISLDVSTLRWSAGGPPGAASAAVRVRKRSNGWWTDNYQGISVTMTHGYTEAEAVDWRRAILSMVDQMSLVPVGGSGHSEFGLSSVKVDDVSLGWAPYAALADDVLFSVESVLCNFSLPTIDFI